MVRAEVINVMSGRAGQTVLVKPIEWVKESFWVPVSVRGQMGMVARHDLRRA